MHHIFFYFIKICIFVSHFSYPINKMFIRIKGVIKLILLNLTLIVSEKGTKIYMKKNIIQGLIMITQLGLSMLTPIFLCGFLGYELNRWLSINYGMLFFIFLGFMVAFRNAYHLTRQFYIEDKVREDTYNNCNVKKKEVGNKKC